MSPNRFVTDPAAPYSADPPGAAPNLGPNNLWDDRYELARELGRGGTAYVYLARDRTTDRQIAIKILRAEFSAAMGEARFHREISIARQLEHPNILTVLESGWADGRLYFTMPYVEGETLRDRLRRERHLPLKAAIAIARDVAGALDHAHERGVIHRDIKPANILLSGGKAIVADFGIARAITVPPGSEITASGMAVGTPEYMSPEQGTSQKELDARSDIYSLGCVFYEMVGGEPPFTGPTSRAIVARHCVAPPPSLRVIRPTVPIGVDHAVEKALAKVPADRFGKASELIDAIEAENFSPAPTPSKFSLRVLMLLAALVVVIGGLAAWYWTRGRGVALDPNRVVVFPLHDPAMTGSTAQGEDVATFIGYQLDATRPLKWLDGWELLDPTARAAVARLQPADAKRLSRSAGAGYYVSGSIVRARDSVVVILRLYDVAGDSLLRLAGVSGKSNASLPQLGVEAMRALLPALVAPGGKLDVASLSARRPSAVANFLQGEREYRRMQFIPALAHYELALREDSAFGLAALRGAQAANWESDFDAAPRLAEIARRQAATFPPAQSLMTRGLYAYLTGAADSAVLFLRQAVQRDSTVHPALTILGEVYLRLLPSEASTDSLARQALEKARAFDSDFAPTLLLLEEIALRDGNVPRVRVLGEELRKAGADTTHAAARALMLQCVRDGPAAVDWQSAVRRDAMVVLGSGKVLAGRASQPGCAIAAFHSLLAADSIRPGRRWSALLGVLAQYAATNRSAEVKAAMSLPGAAGLPTPLAHLLLASAGFGSQQDATIAADSAAVSYERQTATRLWFLGTFEAERHNLERVRSISSALISKADSSKTRRDRLLNGAMSARLRLLEGDTAGTIAQLRALVPTGTRREIIWEPWESLGPERLLLASLLYARHSYEEARRVATQLDAVEPVTYPLYLRKSLEIREASSRAMRNPRLVSQYHARLEQLASH